MLNSCFLDVTKPLPYPTAMGRLRLFELSISIRYPCHSIVTLTIHVCTHYGCLCGGLKEAKCDLSVVRIPVFWGFVVFWVYVEGLEYGVFWVKYGEFGVKVVFLAMVNRL
jgi:hypothetical protein